MTLLLLCGKSQCQDCSQTWPHYSPSVVLSVEQEVRTHDGDAHGHDAQDDQDQHHEAVHIVDFVSPKGRKDEVPEEREQKTCHLLQRSSQNMKTTSVLQQGLTFQWKWTQMEGFLRGRRWQLAPWTWNTRFNMWIWLFRFPPPGQRYTTHCVMRRKKDTDCKFKWPKVTSTTSCWQLPTGELGRRLEMLIH